MSTVCVACKVPQGINIGNGVVIPGPKPYVPSAGGTAPKRPGGFELTEGIPAEAWNRWYATHQDSDLVKNGLIYAHPDRMTVWIWARSHAKVRSGLEQSGGSFKT
jgi:hypothetical protein